MKNRNIIGTGLISSALVVLLSSCSTTLPIVRTTNTPKPIERLVNEPFYDFGKRVCGSFGEGVHTMISDAQDENAIYQVRCEEHGGIELLEVTNFKISERFDYPEPIKLMLENLLNYVKDKKVVLFGEDHDESKREDTKTFVSYIPKLKEAGFTHIGLEIDHRYQEHIDKYVNNPSKENRQGLFPKLPYYKFTLEDELKIVDQAVSEGMQVVCLDNLDPKRTKPRDEYMKDRIDEAIGRGGKVVAFLGGAHVSWSKESEFQYWGDEKIGGATQLHIIKPLGRYLVDSYGRDAVGLVDLTGCYDDYVFACVESK